MFNVCNAFSSINYGDGSCEIKNENYKEVSSAIWQSGNTMFNHIYEDVGSYEVRHNL